MHQQVWRRVAGRACRIGPKVVDPDSADVDDLADHSSPALGTLAPVVPVSDLGHAATIAGDARGAPNMSGATWPRGIKPRAPDQGSSNRVELTGEHVAIGMVLAIELELRSAATGEHLTRDRWCAERLTPLPQPLVVQLAEIRYVVCAPGDSNTNLLIRSPMPSRASPLPSLGSTQPSKRPDFGVLFQ